MLFVNGKNNLIYDAARCFGAMRSEGTHQMPLHRIPFKLIAHNQRFWASDNFANLKLPRIINAGINHCTHYLVTRGLQCTMDLCGHM